MKNLKKVAVVTVLLLIVCTVKSFAMSQEDFIEYVSKPYTINGNKYTLPIATFTTI